MFHTETGEIMYSHKDMKKPRKVASVKGYVGRERIASPSSPSFPFPCECRGPEQLIESVSNLDGYVAEGCATNVSHELLALSVAHKYISPQQLAVLYFLSKNVAAWNYVFVSFEELCEGCGVGSTNIQKVLKGMDGYVTVEKLNKKQLKLLLHPAYIWKGDGNFRRRAIERWTMKAIERKEE